MPIEFVFLFWAFRAPTVVGKVFVCAITCIEPNPKMLMSMMRAEHFKMRVFADDKLYCFIVFELKCYTCCFSGAGFPARLAN